LFSLGVKLLRGLPNPAITEFISQYEYPIVDLPAPPTSKSDLRVAAYQYLNSKAENLASGIFYTSGTLASRVMREMGISSGQRVLDPSCGSGSFLFAADTDPELIVGVDSDPLAVMIARFNYFRRFPDAPLPQIHCDDFFHWRGRNQEQRFDAIVGNPPFGANLDQAGIPSLHVFSGESFSYFIELSFDLLSDDGRLVFIVPEALLNVKRHADIRYFLLNYANLVSIRQFPEKFAGVMSDVYVIEVDRKFSESVSFEGRNTTAIPKDVYRSLNNYVFAPWGETDLRIVEYVRSTGALDLSTSTFGLGVVTGDNASKLLAGPVDGSEPIYTGKEVERYFLRPPASHIVFDRANLQQVAPDEVYRAPVKLVYKTISKSLRVAIDRSGSLTSNSANILIPALPGYDPESVMALLNSDLYSYLHLKLFGGVNKIAKENLQALPFPRLESHQNRTLVSLVRETVGGGNEEILHDFIHSQIFRLSREDVEHIRSELTQFKIRG